MSIVADVAATIEQLGKLIDNTRSIVKAINDGREYLARRHPQAGADFARLLEQMQKAIEGLARVTGVLRGFRFTIASPAATARSLERFNKHVIRHHENVARLRGDLRKMKSSCRKIAEIRDDLNARGKGGDWSSLFGLLGMRASGKRQDLASTLSQFYADDQAMIDVIERSIELAERALKDVDETLGEPGRANPYKASQAAAMLGLYADMFKDSNRKLQTLADEMSATAEGLKRD
jgi:hypothetical protein